MASTELRKHARQIGGHAAAVHMRRAIHPAVLVLAKIVPFASMWVRKHSVGFGNQLEFFFIAALELQKKRSHPTSILPTTQTETGSGERVAAAPCLDDV